MAERDLNNLDFLSLYVGGLYGSKRQDGADAFSGQCNMIKVLADSTVFTTLDGVNGAGTVTDFLTVNNLASKTWSKGDLVLAPTGGYFTDYETTEETEPYTMITTSRIKQQA